MRITATRRVNIPKKQDSAGSVWTSMSDLFTSLAVIFLVLFVVVALKHNLAKVKSLDVIAKYNDFIGGKVPDAQKSKAQESKVKLQESLSQMHAIKQKMMERTQEIEKFTTQIDAQRLMVENILRDQEIKVAAVKTMETQVENKNIAIRNQDKIINDLYKKVQMMEQKINQRDQQISSLTSKLEREVENTETAQIKSVSLKKEMNQMNGIVSEKDTKIQNLSKNINQQEDKISGLYAAIDQKSDTIKLSHAANSGLKQEISDMASILAGKNREISNLKNQTYHKKLRQKIAAKMASRFENLGIDVELDKKTGKIFLRSDQNYLFANASSTLEREMKSKLEKLIPIYSEELLSDPKISSLVTEINIVGHASPRFKKRSVNPFDAQSEAYQFNLNLSVNRANAVAKYVFNPDFGKFKHKNKFRSLIAVSGMSFSKPIENSQHRANAPPLSEQDGLCGNYNCKESRRVEIGFGLREDISDLKDFLVH